MGSPAIAAYVAHVSFWVLLAYGWFWEEIRLLGLVLFVALWAAGFFGLPFIPNGAAMFSSYVAVLDIILVLKIFKGDIRLT